MAKLDLFDRMPPAQADHWHRVRAPGGYEWWEFDAQDDAEGIRAILAVHDGFAFDPEYARRYDAYRRRPTLNIPPVPRQFPAVRFAVFENDKVVACNTLRFGEGAFQAESESNVLTVGATRIEFDGPETRVRFQGGDPAVSAEMVFRAQSPFLHIEQSTFPFDVGEEHSWAPVQPRCDVEGQICFNGRQVRIRGLGYHDHYFGGAPIGPAVRHWLRGRAISPRRTVAFQVCTEESSGLDHFLAFAADDALAGRIDPAGCYYDWNGRTWRGLAYPRSVNFGESLVLRRTRIVDSSPVSLQVVFDAYIEGETCNAWGEIVYPGRLHKGLAHWGVMKWLAG